MPGQRTPISYSEAPIVRTFSRPHVYYTPSDFMGGSNLVPPQFIIAASQRPGAPRRPGGCFDPIFDRQLVRHWREGMAAPQRATIAQTARSKRSLRLRSSPLLGQSRPAFGVALGPLRGSRNLAGCDWGPAVVDRRQPNQQPAQNSRFRDMDRQ